MAFTCKIITTDINNVEADVKTYLDSASPTTVHAVAPFCRGAKILVLIVWE